MPVLKLLIISLFLRLIQTVVESYRTRMLIRKRRKAISYPYVNASKLFLRSTYCSGFWEALNTDKNIVEITFTV